ncbi:MAG: hypothetical protein JHD02_03900 [Thermoleophilaceae bacterium]|nr:hypothetical protein [Thermoleophilaceae bacterium]
MTGPASTHLTTDLARLPTAEHALVVGNGTEAEASWLADRGWKVTTVERDLTGLAADSEHYGLVASLYVPVVGSAEDLVLQLARAVRPDGILYLLGHLAPGQNQISSDDAIAALSPDPWEIVIAEERARAADDGEDSVFYAEKSGSF